jgi:hypothetical protein
MFKDRYHPVHVETDEHFAHLLRYVALNPVTAQLCADPADWPWSSHRLMVAGRESPLAAVRRVEELLGCWGGVHGARYRTLLEPHSPFGSWSDADSPRPPRPTIADLLTMLPQDQAMFVARWEHGYRVIDIAAATGLSETAVSRRTRGR